MRNTILTIYLLLFVPLFLSGQFSKYSNDYLSIGTGSRALAMGNSVIASTTGADALYWNPSAANKIATQMDVGLMHSEYFAGIAKYDFAGAVYRLDSNSVIGGSFIRFGVDNIPGTNNLFDSDGNMDYDKIEKFSVADYALLVSYASKSKIAGLSYGANLKILYRGVGKYASAWGLGFDVSCMYNKNNWLFAAVLRDATSTFTAWSFNSANLEIVQPDGSIINKAPDNSFEWLAPRLIIGAAKRFKVYKKFSVMPEINFEATFDGKSNQLIASKYFNLEPRLGIEIDYNNFVFVRTGVRNLQYEIGFDDKKTLSSQISFGLGVKYLGFSLDYALSNIGSISENMYSNVFSLRYSFDL